MTTHPVRSYANGNAASYIEELRGTVEQILDEGIEYKDDDQEWLQKWWAVRVRVLLEVATHKGEIGAAGDRP